MREDYELVDKDSVARRHRRRGRVGFRPRRARRRGPGGRALDQQAGGPTVEDERGRPSVQVNDALTLDFSDAKTFDSHHLAFKEAFKLKGIPL